MRRFTPHIAFVSILAIVLIFGFATNNRSLAIFAGSLAGASLDPLVLISALIIGAYAKSSKILLSIAIPFAVFVSVWVANMNAQFGTTLTPFFILVRIVSVVGIAYVSNAIRIAVSSKKRRSESATVAKKPTNQSRSISRTLHASKPDERSVRELEEAADRPPTNVENTEAWSLARAIKRIRRHFGTEWLWRLFLVLQSICLLIIIYVDVTNSLWDALPEFLDYRNRFRFDWDFFERRYWVQQQQNWVLMFCVLGPYITAKAISWVGSGNASDSGSQEKG